VATTTAEPVAPAAPVKPGPPPRAWLVGPLFDALFLANVAWPLVVLAALSEGFAGHAGLSFWQVYFVTTPHRWVTLLLVFLDRDRFAQRPRLFVALAAGVALVCLGVWGSTGTLVCLAVIDYLWNAWHFAAQHQGVYRIYGRMSDPKLPAGETAEKWAFRIFLLYVTFRVIYATEFDADRAALFRWLDWAALLLPAGLLVRDLTAYRAVVPGRVAYLVSVCLLYGGLLWAVHERWFPGIVAFTLASALFHATEYLALVSWSVGQRHAALGDRMGTLGYLAPRWGLVLLTFALILGVGGWLMDQDPTLLRIWVALNLGVAFLHYAYDGLIWRRRA